MKPIRFPSPQGHELSALLELPATRARAYALFAHCFTCSKDSKAAVYISRALAAQGIAVLRFDFTGLGASEGDGVNKFVEPDAVGHLPRDPGLLAR